METNSYSIEFEVPVPVGYAAGREISMDNLVFGLCVHLINYVCTSQLHVRDQRTGCRNP